MIQRQVPHGEGFKLRVPRLFPPMVFVVKLAQADRHFPAAWPRRGDHHQRMGGLHVIVPPIPLLADNQIHIMGVPRNRIVAVRLDAQGVQKIGRASCRERV